MSSKYTHTTVNHDEIRRWAEERRGHPASVKGTAGEDEAGLLRIDFEENGEEASLERISWDKFFEKFDEKNLAFVYQDHKKSGEGSTFFKLVDRDSVELDESAEQVRELEADPNVIRALNEVMADHLDLMDKYDKALNLVDSREIASMLAEHLERHEEHVLALENIVLALGGEPVVLQWAAQPSHKRASH